ncbi:MAG: L,D-transpeptidase [Hyphomicrobiaceae bacterium]|nr:L,D-transpeptidase [Hyphomicrobiaceae bacterium]
MIQKVILAAMSLLLVTGSAEAQSWRWSEEGPIFREPRARSYYGYDQPYWGPPPPRYRDYGPPPGWQPYRRGTTSFLEPEPPRRRGDFDDGEPMPRLADGGPKPAISPIPPERVAYGSRHTPGTIIIDTAGRQLLLIESPSTALRYPISVGRQGFTWTGEEKISRIADWPDWHPPAEMRERDPKLPEKMTGGLRNPLGAKALYLGNTLYRIHGTNDARSIGRASSSGCFRMLNGHVIDLASRVSVGAKVVVSSSLRQAESSGRKG